MKNFIGLILFVTLNSMFIFLESPLVKNKNTGRPDKIYESELNFETSYQKSLLKDIEIKNIELLQSIDSCNHYKNKY